MNRLQGKVALVPGAAGGLGAAQTQALAKEGANLVLGDLADQDGQNVAAAIREAGGDAHYLHLDVSEEEDWKEAVRVDVQRYGELGVLVNNAGIMIQRVPIEKRTSRPTCPAANS